MTDIYNLWLSKQILVPQYHSTVSKLLATLPPVTKNPSFLPKSSARVITSEECRQEINEKARMREEAIKQKEERKAERLRKQDERKSKLMEKSKTTQIKQKRYNFTIYYSFTGNFGNNNYLLITFSQ